MGIVETDNTKDMNTIIINDVMDFTHKAKKSRFKAKILRVFEISHLNERFKIIRDDPTYEITT